MIELHGLIFLPASIQILVMPEIYVRTRWGKNKCPVRNCPRTWAGGNPYFWLYHVKKRHYLCTYCKKYFLQIGTHQSNAHGILGYKAIINRQRRLNTTFPWIIGWQLQRDIIMQQRRRAIGLK